MKDVISVDKILKYLAEEIADQFGGDYDEFPNPDEEQRAKASLHSLLISKLPEKRPTIEQFRGTDLKYDAGAFDGYNKCLDDMHRVIDEMFNTKEKIQ